MHDNKIVIYIYYLYSIYNDESFTQKDVCIVDAKETVNYILKKPATKINAYGELTDYDESDIEFLVKSDMENYMFDESVRLQIKYKGVYYIKCEIMRDISQEIKQILAK